MSSGEGLIPIEENKAPHRNWQLHLDERGHVWSVPIVPSAKFSTFGDKRHLLRLARQGQFDLTRLNDAGRELMNGLHSSMIGESWETTLLQF